MTKSNKSAALTSRSHRWFILIASVVPLAAVPVAVVLLWNNLVGWSDIALLVLMYFICGFGITVGYHRLIAHRAFETYKPVRNMFAVMGSMAAQGPVITWVTHHRQHHTFADEDGDPHSPHVGRQSGFKGAIKGLWHAHMGWLFDLSLESDMIRYSPELVKDRALYKISANFVPLVALGLLIPLVLGAALTWSIVGGLTALLWAGLVRIFLQHHLTYSINSVAHFFGRRRFDIPDESRNVIWLSLPTLGDGWHNNHHAFPTSARHGFKRWELDPSGFVIGALERLGLAWNVVKISDHSKAAKEHGGGQLAPQTERFRHEERPEIPSPTIPNGDGSSREASSAAPSSRR